MPKNKDAFTRYLVIDRALRRWLPLSTKRLADICSERLGIPVSIRAIQQDIKNMKENIPLGIFAPIKYEAFKKAHYYIKDTPAVFPSISLNDEEVAALIFYVRTISEYKEYELFSEITTAIEKVLESSNISLNTKSTLLSSSIIETETCARPRGTKWISGIASAIINHRLIEFNYKKFSGKAQKRTLQPLLLKEDKHLWYVIGVSKGKNTPTTFALDRLTNLCVLEEYFDPIDFDWQEYFLHSMGVTVPNEPPIEIILSFTNHQGEYIKALPLHSTQKILKDTVDDLIISITVRPSFELFSKILSYGEAVVVTSPPEIVLELENRLKQSLEKYKNKSARK